MFCKSSRFTISARTALFARQQLRQEEPGLCLHDRRQTTHLAGEYLHLPTYAGFVRIQNDAPPQFTGRCAHFGHATMRPDRDSLDFTAVFYSLICCVQKTAPGRQIRRIYVEPEGQLR
jgi:hypothetical protein